MTTTLCNLGRKSVGGVSNIEVTVIEGGIRPACGRSPWSQAAAAAAAVLLVVGCLPPHTHIQRAVCGVEAVAALVVVVVVVFIIIRRRVAVAAPGGRPAGWRTRPCRLRWAVRPGRSTPRRRSDRLPWYNIH